MLKNYSLNENIEEQILILRTEKIYLAVNFWILKFSRFYKNYDQLLPTTEIDRFSQVI